MGDILTVRVTTAERARWEKAARAARLTVAEFVREAVRAHAERASASPWDAHLGTVDVPVPPPTNANVRRALATRRRRP